METPESAEGEGGKCKSPRIERGRQSRATVASRPARFRALAFFARKLRSNRRRAASGHNSRDFASRRAGCQTAGRQTPAFFLCPSAVALPSFGRAAMGCFFFPLAAVFSLLGLFSSFFSSPFFSFPIPRFFRLLMAGQIKPAINNFMLDAGKMEERRGGEPDFSFSLRPLPHIPSFFFPPPSFSPTHAFPNPSLPLSPPPKKKRFLSLLIFPASLPSRFFFQKKWFRDNRALRMTAIAPDRRRDRPTGAACRKPLRRMKAVALRQDVCPQPLPLGGLRG